jgi:hypothetical protein
VDFNVFEHPTAQEKTYSELMYSLWYKWALADGDVFGGVAGLFFEDDTQVAHARANYRAGYVSIKFSSPVYLTVRTGWRFGGPGEGYEVRVLCIKPAGSAQVVTPAWRPGEIVGRLLDYLLGGEYPTASGVTRLLYIAGEKEARAYNSREVKFEGVSVIAFASVGALSEINPHTAELYSPRGYTFTCVQRGSVLEVSLASQ